MREHTHTTLSQIHLGCNKTKCGTNESFDALYTCVCVMKKNDEVASVSCVCHRPAHFGHHSGSCTFSLVFLRLYKY